MKLGVRGQMRAILRDGETLEVKEDTGWFDNLITDQGLENLVGRGAGEWAAAVYIGDGTTPPTWGDTQLDNLIAGAGLRNEYNGGGIEEYGWSDPVPWQSYSNYARFGTGTSGTVNEIGIGPNSTSLSARQLAPTPFTKGTGDVLDVWYKAFWYFDTTPATGTVDIDTGGGPVTYNWTATLGGLSGSNQGYTWGTCFSNPDLRRFEKPLYYDDVTNSTSYASNARGNTAPPGEFWVEIVCYLGLDAALASETVRQVYTYVFTTRKGVFIRFGTVDDDDPVPFTDKDTMNTRHRLYVSRWIPDVLAETASFDLTGSPADLLRTLRLQASAGAYALTGSDADLDLGFYLAAAAGSVALTGSDATLTHNT